MAFALQTEEEFLKSIQKTWTWVAIGLLLAAFLAAVSFWSFHQTEVESSARSRVGELLTSANGLLSELKDAETGQRGYLLSDNPAFLQPYLSVHDGVRVHLKELQALTLADASQERLGALTPLVDARLEELDQTIALYRRHDTAAALERVNGGEGRRLMERIRAEILGFRTYP